MHKRKTHREAAGRVGCVGLLSKEVRERLIER